MFLYPTDKKVCQVLAGNALSPNLEDLVQSAQ